MAKSRFLLILFAISLGFSLQAENHGSIVRKKHIRQVFVLNIAIDRYSPWLYQPAMAYCVKDALELNAKIIDDADSFYYNPLHDPSRGPAPRIDTVIVYNLFNDSATRRNILKAFYEISYRCKQEDAFILTFNGVSMEEGNATFLYTAVDQDSFDVTGKAIDPVKEAKIPLELMKIWLEMISCEKQLIISEAGSGKEFSNNLVAQLIDRNRKVVENTTRNRYILTTTGLGMEDSKYHGGFLNHMLLQCNNVLELFRNENEFRCELFAAEKSVKPPYPSYSRLISENEYRSFIQAFGHLKTQSRGAEDTEAPPTPIERKGKRIVVLISIDEYVSWRDLDNPIRDAESIGNILRTDYGYEVTHYRNLSMDSLVDKITGLSASLAEDDEVILFFAGHGYYNPRFGDGFLVAADTKKSADDPFLRSYLQFGSLMRITDNLPCNKLFVIFDICFGGNFSQNSRDFPFKSYDKRDIGIQSLAIRNKDKKCRVYLASGMAEVPDNLSPWDQHSPFAQKLIEVLGQKQEFVTPYYIYSRLQGNITLPVLKEFGSNTQEADFFLIQEGTKGE